MKLCLLLLCLAGCAPAAYPVDVAGPAKLALDEAARLINTLETTELTRVRTGAEAAMAACGVDVPCRQAAVAKAKADEVSRQSKIDALIATHTALLTALATHDTCATWQAACLVQAANDLQVLTSNALALVKAIQQP